MEKPDIEPVPILQPPLFVYGEQATNLDELYPAVWNATEALASPDRVTRQHGIDAILDVGAQNVSPLVAYMLATCVNDPDIYIRRRIVLILADLLLFDPIGRPAIENIRKTVSNYLHKMQEETITGILEVAVMDEQADQAIFYLFNACPYAGKYLADIFAQWKNSLPIRQKAVQFIARVGYLEALPVLERMLNRLEARQSEQYLMPFVPASASHDSDILPDLRIAIDQLSAR
jgi:hypothetical protein